MTLQHLEILVEERSMAVALSVLLPKMTSVSFEVREFQGKPDLLSKLEARLRGYQTWLEAVPGAVVVVVDRDDDDCQRLKESIEDVAAAAGTMVASARQPAAAGAVLVRIVVEELEAWFFGDVPALVQAYPGVPASLGQRKGFREPDAVAGGTWEALERVLKQAGHHRGGLAKVRAAREISPYMDVDNNTSRSFQVFRDGIRHLVAGAQA